MKLSVRTTKSNYKRRAKTKITILSETNVKILETIRFTFKPLDKL